MSNAPNPQSWDNFWSGDKSAVKGVSWSKRRIMAVLERQLRPGLRVLDAGCGSGFFSAFFAQKGCDVVAVDFSDSALALTRRFAGEGVRVEKQDLLSPDLVRSFSKKFDLIFSDGLFEHFSPEQQDAIVKNFKGVLREEGKIATFVPNRWSPWQLLRPFLMPGIAEDPFTFRQLLALNARNGLDVREAGGLNTVPFRRSPDGKLGKTFGMLVYTIAERNQKTEI